MLTKIYWRRQVVPSGLSSLRFDLAKAARIVVSCCRVWLAGIRRWVEILAAISTQPLASSEAKLPNLNPKVHPLTTSHVRNSDSSVFGYLLAFLFPQFSAIRWGANNFFLATKIDF